MTPSSSSGCSRRSPRPTPPPPASTAAPAWAWRSAAVLPDDGRRHRRSTASRAGLHLHRSACPAEVVDPAERRGRARTEGRRRAAADGRRARRPGHRRRSGRARPAASASSARRASASPRPTGGEEGLRAGRRAAARRHHARRDDAGHGRLGGPDALKADPELADIPVIMLTMVDDQNMGFALGAAGLPDQADRPRAAARPSSRNIASPVRRRPCWSWRTMPPRARCCAACWRRRAGRWPRRRTAAWRWSGSPRAAPA